MRLVKISLIAFTLGLIFIGISYIAASRLEEAKAYSYPESVGRHYAQHANATFDGGGYGSGILTEFRKSVPLDAKHPIDAIEVETVALKVELLPSETDAIEINLAAKGVDRENPVLVDSSRGNTLHIVTQEENRGKVGRNGWMVFNFSDDKPKKKNVLQIRIPKSRLAVQIRTVSGDARIATTLSSLTFQSKSGDVRISTSDPLARVEHLDVQTVSGDLKGAGRFDRLKFQSVSGDIEIKGLDRVLDIDGQSVSGDLKVETGDDVDAEIDFQTKSGDLKIDDSVSKQAKAFRKNEIFKIGKGTARIKFHSVSGDLKIERAGENFDSESNDNSDESSKSETDDESALFTPTTPSKSASSESYLGCVVREALRANTKIGRSAAKRCVRFFA